MNKRGLRIALVMGYGPGKLGALEKFTIFMARAAAERGHFLHIIYIHPTLQSLIKTLENEGSMVTTIPTQSRLNPLFGFRLFQYLRRGKIHVLDCQFDLVNITGTVIGFLAGVPSLFWHQMNYLSPRLMFFKRMVYKVLNNIIDGVICSSPALADEMIKKGIKSDLVHSIPPGIDFKMFDDIDRERSNIRTTLNIASEVPIVVVVSQARIEKGCIHLVRASRDVLKKYPTTRFLHVGGGPLEKDLIKEAENLGINESWMWLGERSDVPQILTSSDMLVLPSIMDALPNVVLEAGIAGLPVVASRVGGVPQVVKDGITGILASPQDENTIVDAICRLLGDKSLCSKMGKAAKAFIREGYAVEKQVERTLDLYEKVVESKRLNVAG